MEISQHIKDLLFTHDRVILSGFGAFIAKYTPAKINEETKTISPPGKEIVFDSKIVKDGGLLEGYMADREKISVEESSKQIDEYVKTVISKLNAGKKVIFPDLGTFSKTKEGVLEFLYQPSGNLLLDSFGLPKITLPEKILNIKQPGKSKQKVSANNTETTPVSPPSTSKNNKWIIWTAIPVAIALILTAIYFIKPTIWKQGKETISGLFKSDNKDTLNSDTLISENINNNENNTGGNEVINNVDTSKNVHENVHNDENKVKLENKKIINPENNSNNVVNTNNVVNNNIKTGDLKDAQKGKYYLIIGSLPTVELAKKETARFKKMGISSNIIPAGESRFRISLGEFNSSKDATSFYNDFHTKYQSINPWLWENK